jgi:hypothetical protein
MTRQQNRRTTGKSGRSHVARIAERETSIVKPPRQLSARRRLPLFAQFPPAALFDAIRRGISRNAGKAFAASGTPLAISRVWHVVENP